MIRKKNNRNKQQQPMLDLANPTSHNSAGATGIPTQGMREQPGL